jgi:hypothetical protein
MLRIRQVEPADHAEWLALRTALWPDENAAELAVEVARFFAEPSAQPGAMLEAVLVAVDSDEPAPGLGVGRALGFDEVTVLRCFRKALAPEGT